MASAGNDYRLGGNEAPPAIISMFIGSDLKKILRYIENDLPYSDEVLNRMDIDLDILTHYVDKKNIKLFEKFNVYTKEELQSRCDILLEEYSKTLNIESLTMIDMAKKDIIPSVCAYSNFLTNTALNKRLLLEGCVKKSINNKIQQPSMIILNYYRRLFYYGKKKREI